MKKILFLGADNTLYHPESTSSRMKGFRAYFQLQEAAEVKDFVLNLGDGETTGIRSLTPDPSPIGEGSIYTLDGRRISQPAKKGVYVKNGKKVIIK